MTSSFPPNHRQPATMHSGSHALSIAMRSLLKVGALTAGGLLLSGAGNAQAQTVLPGGHQQIREAVQIFIEDLHETKSADQRIEIVVSNIDPRLAIPACDLPLQTQLGQQAGQSQKAIGRLNVRVDCQGSVPWSKYVPVLVRMFAPVLMSTRPLARGDLVGAADVEMVEADLSTLRQSYLHESTLAVGMEVKRAMPANSVVSREALAQPLLIKRGDTVVMSAQSGPVTIRQQGIAMQNGELGAQIPVRNTNSDIVVRAVVSGPGQVGVNF